NRHDSGNGVIARGPVSQIVGRLQALEIAISEEKGPFSLFALFLREESPDRWDLVAAASWMTNRRNALDLLSGKLGEALTRQQLLIISRIVILGINDRFLSSVHAAFELE